MKGDLLQGTDENQVNAFVMFSLMKQNNHQKIYDKCYPEFTVKQKKKISFITDVVSMEPQIEDTVK